MSLYDSSIPQLSKMLQNLERWLDKAADYAKTRNFDPETLLVARLAPDQYPLRKQIQAACDSAKFPAARLTGKKPPSHPDGEQTLPELRERIQSVISYLGSFKPEDFAGADKRQIELTFAEGQVIDGSDYLCEMALPNFYFHIVTAYSILRHNGVDLGKIDFIGSLNLRAK
jgi:hypothetical protein